MVDGAAPSLDRFFSPRAIAIIGASPERSRIRGLLLHLLRQNGYRGEIYPVNPSYREIDGIPCFPSIAAIGTPVDLALVAIPAEGVLPALAACAAAGVAHAVIISSGFAEQGGAQRALQEQIGSLARRTSLRVSGPNAEGFYNEIDRVAATFSPAVDRKAGEEPLVASERRIGIVAQSGGMGFALYDRGRAMGLSFSYVVSTGNEADLTASDFFDYMARDADTHLIMLFIEGVRDPETFLAAAAAASARGKPVLVAKVGRTTAGERAAQSHTASMAGWSAAYDAVFARHGIIPVTDPDEAVAVAAALASAPLPQGDRVAVVTTSGGAGAWTADALAGAGLALPTLSPSLQEQIRAVIPAYGSALNPVDITAQAVHTGGLIRVVELLSEATEVDAIVVVLSLASETRISIDATALARIVSARRKPVLFYSYTLPSPLGRKMLAQAGLPLQTHLTPLAAAMRALVRRGRSHPVAAVETLAADAPRLPAALLCASSFSEHDAKQILARAGIPLPPQHLVTTPGQLDAVAAALGFPLAVKIQSPDIAHKTEIGGVRLGLADTMSLRTAYDGVIAAARAHRPSAHIQGVLVQRMAPAGIELIIGTVCDPVFGPMIMVGAGGVMAELLNDAAYRMAPVDRAQAKAMISELRIAKLLAGFRGGPPADTDALALLIAQLSAIAAAHRDLIQEIELNPVLVHPEGRGCTILDALLTPRR